MKNQTPHDRPRLPIVVVGHVDHGKSTVIGRLLADTNSLPQGKLEQVRLNCQKNARPFEYAFLLDALKEEQAQGITIDVARIFFQTPKRGYLIIDAPGHIEFLKNMVTGASHAKAAILLIDAKEGIQENSRRHCYLLSMLGIKDVIVLVNKMDLVGFSQSSFESIVNEYKAFLKSIHVSVSRFIPISGFQGDNVVQRSTQMSWYDGATLLESLESIEPEQPAGDRTLRMPIQDVYKFTRDGDDRRIIAGTIESGTLNVGDEVVFYPGKKTGKVKSIETFPPAAKSKVESGWATGFTLQDQIYVHRGQIVARKNEVAPEVTTRLLASVLWLGSRPMVHNRDYTLKLGSARVPIRIESIRCSLNCASLEQKPDAQEILRNEVAEVTLQLQKPIGFDLSTPSLSRFVIVDEYDICGGGIIRSALADSKSALRESIFLRNEKWEDSAISEEARAQRFGQKPCVIFVTGAANTNRKEFAKSLEEEIFKLGHAVYYLGMGNVVYGLDADIRRMENTNTDHIRRVAEISHIMLNAGMILVVSALELSHDDLDSIRTVVEPHTVLSVWLGKNVTTDLEPTLQISEGRKDKVEEVTRLLRERGLLIPGVQSL